MNKKPIAKNQGKKMNNNKIVLTIVCVFLAIVLIFGIIFGAVLGVKNAKATVSYRGITISGEELSYLATYYKYEFIRALTLKGIVAYDTPDFWERESYEGDSTYGEMLVEYTERYVREVVASCYIFDTYASLTSSDKETIERCVSEVLDYKADNDKDTFNSQVEKYGFDYSAFRSVTAMLYKASRVRTAVYGFNGENLVNFPEECEKYFENYSHVKLLFIRTEDKFLLDDKGNRVRDENNHDILVPLTDSEKAERASVIGEIRAAIASFENGGTDVQMSPEMFNHYMTSHGDGDPSMRNVGYYFFEDAAYTKEFSEKYKEVVDKSLSMQIGSYGEALFDKGVCFIYKYKNTEGAYADNEEGGCFSDFYPLAAEEIYSSLLEKLCDEVKVKDSFFEFDFLGTPYNNVFVPRF